MNKIDIVVPVYNVAEYLVKCFDSLLNQETTVPYQIIVVNDGSTDNSQVIISEYATKYPNQFKSLIKENGGLSDARNFGLQYVNSEYVIFIDSDDFVESDLIERVYQQAIKTDVDMIIYEYNQYWSVTNTKEVISNNFSESKIYNLKDTPELLTGIANAAWNKMYRTKLFTDNEILYPKGYRYEDLGTTYKLLLEASSVAFVNRPLINYLVDRPGNITTTYDKKLYDILDMCQVNLDYYRQKNVFETYYEELKVLSIRNILECLKKVVNMTDQEFVRQFIDDCFKFIKVNFPDYRKSKKVLVRERYDGRYLNPTLCRLSYNYKNRKRR
jgi:glycosyltransferase involved in cell wall biosynthesis